MADKRKGPLFRVLNRVFGASAPYTPVARLVALAVAARLDEDWLGWMSIADICRRTGYSRSAVKTALNEVCDGPKPLFARVMSTKTKGRVHRPCYEFRLVSDPEAFAASRDAARRLLHDPKDKPPITTQSPDDPKDRPCQPQVRGASGNPVGGVSRPDTRSQDDPKDLPELLPEDKREQTNGSSACRPETTRKRDRELTKKNYSEGLDEIARMQGRVRAPLGRRPAAPSEVGSIPNNQSASDTETGDD